MWFDLVQVWNAIDQGNPQWQIPTYNGGLFSTDRNDRPGCVDQRRSGYPTAFWVRP